jgi:hypothetical protein
MQIRSQILAAFSVYRVRDDDTEACHTEFSLRLRSVRFLDGEIRQVLETDEAERVDLYV